MQHPLELPRVEVPQMSESDAAAHLSEKHEQMIRNAQLAGREIPAVGVSMEVVGEDVARPAVEASQRSMRRANRKIFLIPELPWHRKKG